MKNYAIIYAAGVWHFVFGNHGRTLANNVKMEVNMKNTNKNNKYNIEEIITMYRPLILASITRYCNLIGYYDDLYQDGVVAIIEALKSYDPSKGSVGGYLKTYLKFFYINKYKRIIRRECDEIGYKEEPTVSPIDDYENKMYIAKLLSKLPDDQRVVIELNFLMDMRASEISKVLGIPKRRVYYLKEKAINSLRRLAKEYK